MHEFGIVQEMIRSSERELKASGAEGRVVEIRLVVGRLSGASTEALRMAFDILKPGTRFADAELVMDQPMARATCIECGATSEVDELFAPCASCRSCRVAIEGGRELLLSAIEVE
ncbi:hydrogenase maturation nickel metallochaperone HypA [Candidatus Hydrogenedentota bacterium]